MTLHRPAKVDEASKLKELMDEIINNTQDMPLVFPVRSRTKKMLNNRNRTRKVAYGVS